MASVKAEVIRSTGSRRISGASCGPGVPVRWVGRSGVAASISGQPWIEPQIRRQNQTQIQRQARPELRSHRPSVLESGLPIRVHGSLGSLGRCLDLTQVKHEITGELITLFMARFARPRMEGSTRLRRFVEAGGSSVQAGNDHESNGPG